MARHAWFVLIVLKGKLAHNFMISYLVWISHLSDMVRTFIIDKNAKIDTFHIYGGKKSNFRTLVYWVSQSVPVLRH